MKLLTIDEALKGKDLYEFLKANKTELIGQKKSLIKKTDALTFPTELYKQTKEGAVKTDSAGIDPEATSVSVKVVANTAMWMDSQKDVILPKAANRSIKNNKDIIPHLRDHDHSVEAIVGDVKNIYAKNLSLKTLGLDLPGETESIIFDSDVQKAYSEKVFKLYVRKQIKQHSIGLRYIQLDMAINDADYKEEFANWNKYIDQVINKEEAEASGYFWIVPEYQLLENSCVLFGANKLTPTLEAKDDGSTPGTSKENPPTEVTHETFDISKALERTNIFFN